MSVDNYYAVKYNRDDGLAQQQVQRWLEWLEHAHD